MNKKITSRSNEIIKSDLKLKQSKYRRINKEYIIFGNQLISEAIDAGVVTKIYTTSEEYNSDLCEVIIVSKEILNEFTDNASCDKVAICQITDNSIDYNERTIILDDLQDPGNVGTIIRTAKAFGYKQVVLSNESVDIYNSKTLRSMHGANFQMKVVKCDIKEFLRHTNNKLITTYLDEKSNIDMASIDKSNINIMFGNEGNGISADFKSYEHINYKLDLQFESLNVSVAAGIIMYKLR